MLILNADQIREWDQYTIQNEPILSIDLMERAATACCEWLLSNGYSNRSFSIFCAKGNNGGDGLAIARLLSNRELDVTVNILEFGHKGTEDFQVNLARLHENPVEIRFISSAEAIPHIPEEEIIIDALLGSGLNRPLEGLTAELVDHLNRSGAEIIAIDIPSGLSADQSAKGNTVIKAAHTLSFQCFKPAFLFAENEEAIGELHVLDIGLKQDFADALPLEYKLSDHEYVKRLFRPRKKFAHKGNFGHALLIAGSFGKMGAAILSAKACIKTGSGLLSVHSPRCGYDLLQSQVPEAMVIADKEEEFNTALEEDLSPFNAIGVGPGIGVSPGTAGMLYKLLQRRQLPMIIDADALNLLAANPKWLDQLPAGSILTPHPKEFDRLFGASPNDFERMKLASQKAKALSLVIVLKGHYTLIAVPSGEKYFNTTGNAGMAKGGSGDALTGIITALMAQGYPSVDAALLGVYLHGKAGDIAAQLYSQESLTASDIIDSLGEAFLSLY
ncbi:MAG: NAD(P)H-hydrate dehydratase [Chitinophagaceae bacterium]|nr:NAD(P)H-hydrate dehydratase [Chitinophagaceae bacterium]